MSRSHVLLFCACSLALMHNYIISNETNGGFLSLEDASENYQLIAHQALKDFNVENFENVPIKKIGKIPKYFLGNNTVSFTMYGIWIDEEMLSACPKKEIVFTLYQEAAHYVQRHHAKLLLSLVPASACLYALSHAVAHLVGGKLLTKTLVACASGMSILFGIDRYMMQPIVRKHGKEAELAAARVLCKVQKHDVVFAHIDYLQNLLSKGEASNDCWWHSITERVTYINEFMQTQNINS